MKGRTHGLAPTIAACVTTHPAVILRERSDRRISEILRFAQDDMGRLNSYQFCLFCELEFGKNWLLPSS